MTDDDIAKLIVRHELMTTAYCTQRMFEEFARAIIAQARAELIAELNPVAWSNPDEEGEPDMLFPSRSEAESYCDDDEEPIELVIKPKE